MIIAIGLYQGFTALDAIGPYEVLSCLPGAEVVICAEHTGPLDDQYDVLHLRIDTTFADVPRPDVLLVPGSPTAAQYAADGHPIVDWIRDAHPHTAWTTSVCTGALLLGAAGLLNGVPATTHWHFYDDLAAYGAQPTEQRVVTSGRNRDRRRRLRRNRPRPHPRREYRRTRSGPRHSASHRIRPSAPV